jgi:hypothetical protein
MNPLQWKREHQLAWILVGVLGGMVGLLFAWVESPAHRVAASLPGLNQANAFLIWLPRIGSYWHWPAFGIAIAALAFYVVMLFRCA